MNPINLSLLIVTHQMRQRFPSKGAMGFGEGEKTDIVQPSLFDKKKTLQNWKRETAHGSNRACLLNTVTFRELKTR